MRNGIGVLLSKMTIVTLSGIAVEVEMGTLLCMRFYELFEENSFEAFFSG